MREVADAGNGNCGSPEAASSVHWIKRERPAEKKPTALSDLELPHPLVEKLIASWHLWAWLLSAFK